MKPITDLDQLRYLAREQNFECRINLNGGCYSRKTISWDPEEMRWIVYNHIDETKDIYEGDQELCHKYPLFFEAIKYGALVYEPETCYV